MLENQLRIDRAKIKFINEKLKIITTLNQWRIEGS